MLSHNFKPKRHKLPAVTLYIRRNSQPGQPYDRVNLKNIEIIKAPDVYCLHFFEQDKRKWQTVGTDLKVAIAALQDKQRDLLSQAPAPPPTPKPSPDQPASLEQLRKEFIADKKTSRKKNGELRDEDTIRGYEQLTREFLDFVGVERSSQITGKVIKTWIKSLYERKRHGGDEPVSHRTVCNLYVSTVCFLHFVGIDHKLLVPEAERPVPIEEEPEAYTDAELDKFFASIDDHRDRLFFRFLQRTGAREKEATHLEWSNLNLGEKPTVTFRNQGGFKTKTRKFRTIPLDPEFAAELRAWQHEHGQEKYVFARDDGKVEGHYLRKCKDYAKAAGLDSESFWLHKFRDTAATTWLLRQVPLRTVQKWMGHSSIMMTERYLAPEQDDVQQMRMANVWARPGVAASAAVAS